MSLRVYSSAIIHRLGWGELDSSNVALDTAPAGLPRRRLRQPAADTNASTSYPHGHRLTNATPYPDSDTYPTSHSHSHADGNPNCNALSYSLSNPDPHSLPSPDYDADSHGNTDADT